MECLYNTNSDNVVAYCQHHRCAMTVKQMRCKNCLGKQCHYLQKNESHQYWHQRDLKKQKRKNRKERIDNYVSSIKGQV